jgi:hypothetical protein
MSPEERMKLSSLKRIDVWFNYELKEGESVDISKATSDGTIFFSGKKEDQKTSFEMKLIFFD